MELHQKTILITGGASGIGRELAGQLLALGNTVLITGRDQARLDQAKKDLPQLHIFKSDVAEAGAIKKLAEEVTSQFPELDILINNAGEMRIIVLKEPNEELTREIEINLNGPIKMIEAFLPHLLKKENAAIVNVSSGLALIPFPISPIYSATKAGLHAYTQALRVQLKNTRVKVFELLPPASTTALNEKFNELDGFSNTGSLAPGKIAKAAIEGLQNDKSETYPGITKILKVMSRLSPGTMLKQFGKVGAKKMNGGG